MNQQIQELMTQAGTDSSGKWMGVEHAEKFAQLIVKECIDTVSDCSVEYCTRPQIVSEIREHFGVEE